MNLPEFQAKWSPAALTLTERSDSQSHFNDLCALFGVPTPVAADPTGERRTFEKGAAKATGGDDRGTGGAGTGRSRLAATEKRGTPVADGSPSIVN